METKNPRPGKVEGFGFHRADDKRSHITESSDTQLPTDPVGIAPSIHVRRDGAFFRMQIIPPEALPPAMARPSTYGSYASAMLAARWLEVETGWPVIDLAKGG
jgi:hypothetical protein